MRLILKLGLMILTVTSFYMTVTAIETNRSDIALYPQQNAYRNRFDLSGIWKFKTDPESVGESEKWWDGLKQTRSVAVPGSWNEQFVDLRNYLGLVWYENEAYIPDSWKGQKIYLRFGSVNYMAKVWINGEFVVQHEGGQLPFSIEVGDQIKWGNPNRITVSVENELKPERVPTGNVPGGFIRSFPAANYDFFPYAGINRAVEFYCIPGKNLKDLTITTEIESGHGLGLVNLKIESNVDAITGEVQLSGGDTYISSEFKIQKGIANLTLEVPNVRLWDTEDPFLYDLKVLLVEDSKVVDQYETTVGVRTISVDGSRILLNGKPIFLKGFGKHIDFPIFGRATAHPVMIKDFGLMKWIGANSFRTSHYPYDEEYMQMADREGFLIVNETPAVGLYFHGDKEDLASRQKLSKQYIEELIARDKNHPSVIMWCVANEPFPEKLQMGRDVDLASQNSSDIGAEMLAELTSFAKSLDASRLVTFTGVSGGPVEWLSSCDVISVNRYWGWYTHTGDLSGGLEMLSNELDSIHEAYQKPILIAEFGADTISGFHGVDAEMFTEEFQVEFIRRYLDVMDTKDFVVGAHVWNFADFRTGQGIIRMGGMNLKGVFTRDREPKMAAHYLRSRWNSKNAKVSGVEASFPK